MTEDELKVSYIVIDLMTLLVHYLYYHVLTSIEISDWPVPGSEGCGYGFHQQNLLHDAV